MVVSSVHILPINDGLSGPQMIDTYVQQLEALGAKKSGNYSIECETYLSNIGITTIPNQQKILNLLTVSDYPASAFSLIENGPTIVTDSTFEQILTNLNNFYTPRKLARMEVRGQRWTLNDFIIKLGSCTMGPNFKAIISEIEYGPCCVPRDCWHFIKELAEAFIGKPIQTPHQHLMTRMNDTYSPVDTVHQYNDLFNQLKKVNPSAANMNASQIGQITKT
ncbi:hypothetical protein RDWZM_007234 [Blomia tropicalis]|uniref:Mediator of RNA polymerase II transcription subunit 20 n=1 Tax=Blomia tropicalis TaxID=40697 RepID=A0A9Q0M999_BLOTA|nr:mediator complex subunit Med20 [Blomia tropicalis]KAJ6221422.1 hypothetical protein RDWZM_007234 [Blomia tropicalis]